MHLRTMAISHYRSLANVVVERCSDYNVPIGRNNSGKSSVFGALAHLGQILRGRASSGVHLLTGHDASIPLRLELTFNTSSSDREGFVDAAFPAASADRQTLALKSGLLRQISYAFATPSNAPQLLHLRSIRILSEDAKWAEIYR